MKIVQKLKSTR